MDEFYKLVFLHTYTESSNNCKKAANECPPTATGKEADGCDDSS